MTRTKYKPLLFTLALRSPYRIEQFLNELSESELDGKDLTKENIEKLYQNLIKIGMYKTNGSNADFGNLDEDSIKKRWKDQVFLEDFEAEKLVELNAPSHKEKGFSKGWSSRFHTHYEISKRLGFVEFTYQKDLEEAKNKNTEKIWENLRKNSIPIKLTETGKEFIDINTNPAKKQALYTNGLMRLHRNGLIIYEKNKNRPLPLLLSALKKIIEIDDKGVSKFELLIWGYWKNNNPDELVNAIVKFREKYGPTPSRENIIDYCVNNVQGGDIARDPDSITKDYVDNYFRYLHYSGLFTYRGGGRYITLNKESIKVIDYIIENHSEYIEFKNEIEYLKFLSSKDEEFLNLFTYDTETKEPTKVANLKKWLDEFGIEVVKEEINKLGNSRAVSRNEILKNIVEPLRLEFLASLYLHHKYSECEVKPSYRVDDEGLPTGFASGVGDIEVVCSEDATLYEVTLHRDYNNQVFREIIPIDSHLTDFKKSFPNATAVMIAPKIHERVAAAASIRANESGNKPIKLITINDYFV